LPKKRDSLLFPLFFLSCLSTAAAHFLSKENLDRIGRLFFFSRFPFFVPGEIFSDKGLTFGVFFSLLRIVYRWGGPQNLLYTGFFQFNFFVRGSLFVVFEFAPNSFSLPGSRGTGWRFRFLVRSVAVMFWSNGGCPHLTRFPGNLLSSGNLEPVLYEVLKRPLCFKIRFSFFLEACMCRGSCRPF